MSLSRIPLLLAVALLGACKSSEEKQMLDMKRANSRAIEQRKMNIVTQYADQGVTMRGAELAIVDPTKAFDPSAAKFGNARSISAKGAQTNEFNFVDRVRTKDFTTKAATTKNAWMGDMEFATKEAPSKESWFARKTARATNSYETRAAMSADKSASTRALPGGDKPFLVKGRRQAEYDTKGPEAQAMGGSRNSGESWSGDLKPMTIEDVKSLLNKN